MQRALQRGVPLSGKRELSLGAFRRFACLSYSDSKGKCFAVVAFDTNEPEELFYYYSSGVFKKLPADQILSSN